MDPLSLYPDEPRLRDLLYTHSRAVADEALAIARRLIDAQTPQASPAAIHPQESFSNPEQHQAPPCTPEHNVQPGKAEQTLPDLDFIERAALLHDIGIMNCDAPTIYCFGTLPYICHGIEGARILAEEGMLREARVCERHTGSGLTADEILDQGLPLPARDMLPETLEEKIICYADKFYSKNPARLRERKPLAKVIKEMARHGRRPLERFLRLHTILS